MDRVAFKTLLIVGLFIVVSAAHLGASAPKQAGAAYDHYLKALLYETSGNLLTAQKELSQALAIEPDSAHLQKEFAELCFFLGQLNKARDAIEKALKLDATHTKAFILAGQIYWSMGDTQAAEEKLEQAVQLSPDESEPLISLAMAVTLRDPNKAIELYAEFLKRHPGEVEIQERLAQLYRSQGELDKAKSSWEKALEWDPGSLKAHLALAQLAEVDHDTTTAISHYKAVLNRDPANLPLLLRVGELQYRNNKMGEAFQAFSKAQKIAPESASANFWLALLHEHRGEWKQAIQLLEKVAEKSPEPGVYLRLSYYHTQLGQHAESVEILKKLSQDEPENTDFLNYLAIAYEQQGKFGHAVQAMHKLVDIDSHNPEPRFYLATLYDRWGKFEKAEEQLTIAIELNPSFALALNYLGYSYADRNMKLEEAESLLVKAIELEPDKSAYLDSLGWVYYRMGKFEKAVDYLTKASIQGNDPLIWEHLGTVQHARGFTTQAILAWDESLRMDPDQPKLKKKVAKTIKRLKDREKAALFIKRNLSLYNDLNSIKGLVKIKVCRGVKCFENMGEIHYDRHKKMKIDIPGPLGAPVLTVQKPYQKKAHIGALHPQYQTVEQLVAFATQRLEEILSGDLFRAIDMVTLKKNADSKRRKITSSAGDQRFTFEDGSGNLILVEWLSTKEEMECRGRQAEAWPWIPSIFKWNDEKSGTAIELELKKPFVSPVSTLRKE